MMTFTQAQVIQETGATTADLDYWNRIDVIAPHRQATSSGDKRRYSILNVIEVAQAVELKRVGMSAERIKLLLATQRTRLQPVPTKCRAVAAWLNYVKMIRANALTFGETLAPEYERWEGEVATVLRRLEKKPIATEYQLLDLLAAQYAARRGDPGGRLHAQE